MKAGIDDNGVLYIRAENAIENYALNQWAEVNAICGDKKVDIDIKEFAILGNHGGRII